MRVSSPRMRDKNNFVVYVTDVSILMPRVTWVLYHKSVILQKWVQLQKYLVAKTNI